ncbi:MAG: cell wall-associated NlpC family hydrolase [Alphaproteobacteria bacterium]|jgi:cell wall-associated NlpC family hydrolase
MTSSSTPAPHSSLDSIPAFQRANVRYPKGVRRQVGDAVLSLFRAPTDDIDKDTELLYGESVTVYDSLSGVDELGGFANQKEAEDPYRWSFVQNDADNYTGYVRSNGLCEEIHNPTHVVQAVATFVYAHPDIKSAPLRRLDMGARVTTTETIETFLRDARGGWVCAQHLKTLGDHKRDYAGLALQFMETPYLWGGKSSLGLDCSGLVQIVLDQCGIAAPRDSGDQVRSLGHSLGADAIKGDFSQLTRGDLVFWRGHVGIYVDEQVFVHANATDMKVSTAPLTVLASAIEAATGDGVTDIRRL